MPNDTPLFVCGHTADYRHMAERLAASLDRLGLPHLIVEKPNEGSRGLNLIAKPRWFHEIADSYPAVWIDADGEVLKWPTLLQGPDALAPVSLLTRQYTANCVYAPDEGFTKHWAWLTEDQPPNARLPGPDEISLNMLPVDPLPDDYGAVMPFDEGRLLDPVIRFTSRKLWWKNRPVKENPR